MHVDRCTWDGTAHKYIHTYIRTTAYIHTCIYLRWSSHNDMEISLVFRINVDINARDGVLGEPLSLLLHTYIHTDINTYIHTYKHTYKNTHIHTYINTYIHTYKRKDTYTDTESLTKHYRHDDMQFNILITRLSYIKLVHVYSYNITICAHESSFNH